MQNPIRLQIGGKIHVIRTVFVHTKWRCEFRYKGHDFTVWREEEDEAPDDREDNYGDGNPPEPVDPRYHIIGLYKDGGTVYDGRCDDDVETLEAAIKEALLGSCLASGREEP